MSNGTNLIHLSAALIALIACVTDIRARRIPNALVLTGLALGLGLQIGSDGFAGALRSLGGAGLGLVLFLPFFLLGGMGAGDVKLLCALGALLGPADVLKVALAAALAGGLLALAVAARERRLLPMLRGIAGLLAFWLRGGLRPSPDLVLENPSTLAIPYAIPVAAGTVLVALNWWRW